MKKKLLFFAVLLGLVFTLGWRGFAMATSSPEPKGTLRIALADLSEQIVDPILGNNINKVNLSLMYDWLVASDDDGTYNLNKSVAYKWETSPDHKTWTFWIRKGIKFHNGDDLTADDVKFTIDRTMSDRSISTYKPQLVKWVDRTEVVPPDKVVIHCKNPVPFMPYWLSDQIATEGMILPKKYIEQKGDDYFALHPVGSGPYRFAENVRGSYIKFEAMPAEHWWSGMPKYKYVYLDLVPERSVRVARLKTGEADIISVSREEVSELKAAKFKILEKTGIGVGIWFSQTWDPKNPFSKEKVRKALCLAINKEEILQHVFGGLGRVSGLWPAVKGSLGWIDTPPYPYDPDQAKKLLREAGYSEGFSIDVWAYPYGTCPEGNLFMEAIAGYFDKIGLKTKVIKGEYVGIRTKIADDTLLNPASVGYLSTTIRRFYIGFYNFFWNSKGTFHLIKDPQMDALIAEAQAATTEETYTKAVSKVFREVYDRYLTCPVVEISTIFATKPNVPEWSFPVAIDFGFRNLTTPGK